MLTSTLLVLLMVVPGLALLQKLRYGGAQHPLLRHKAVGLFPSQ